MTNRAKVDELIKLAEFDGFGWKSNGAGYQYMVKSLHSPSRMDMPLCDDALKYIPDYFNDLNAVKRLEDKLDDTQYVKFCYELKRIRNEIDRMCCRCKSAPADQRCKAILKVI